MVYLEGLSDRDAKFTFEFLEGFLWSFFEVVVTSLDLGIAYNPEFTKRLNQVIEDIRLLWTRTLKGG